MRPLKKPIYVTRPFLPPFEEFCLSLREIWESRWLTNNGPIVRRFHEELCRLFQTDHVCLFGNGTSALQIALQGMEISGEVITTPFTFVATTHSLFWNKITPVFVDIEPEYYTIDPEKIEAAITPGTTAILAVHVYGNPCRVKELAHIAERHNLRLIYDAAHAFGVKVGDASVARFGDLSMFSFHATKLFHSIEGGMLIFREGELKGIFDYLKNFGIKNEVEVVMPGTNAKMNELQALMGSLILKYLDTIIGKRAAISNIYRTRLNNIPGIRLLPPFPHNVTYNHAYMPIEVEEEQFGASRDELYEQLKLYNVFTRRYFYPLVCDYACYRHLAVKDPLTTARRVADRILTLPLYEDLPIPEAEAICDIMQHLHLQARQSLKAKTLRDPEKGRVLAGLRRKCTMDSGH